MTPPQTLLLTPSAVVALQRRHRGSQMKLAYFFLYFSQLELSEKYNLNFIRFWTFSSRIFWNQEWRKCFSGVIPQNSWFYNLLHKIQCVHVCTRASYLQAKLRRKEAPLRGSGAFDLLEANSLFLFYLGMPHPLIYLPFISFPLPSPSPLWSGNCSQLRGSISCSALLLPCLPPRVGQGDCIPVLALTLPLRVVFTRIVPLWDAPYLFLITYVTQIELFSSSSKGVPYTLD